MNDSWYSIEWYNADADDFLSMWIQKHEFNKLEERKIQYKIVNTIEKDKNPILHNCVIELRKMLIELRSPTLRRFGIIG